MKLYKYLHYSLLHLRKHHIRVGYDLFIEFKANVYLHLCDRVPIPSTTKCELLKILFVSYTKYALAMPRNGITCATLNTLGVGGGGREVGVFLMIWRQSMQEFI